MIHADSSCFRYNNKIGALVYCILLYYCFVQTGHCAQLNHEINYIKQHQQQKCFKVSSLFSSLIVQFFLQLLF